MHTASNDPITPATNTTEKPNSCPLCPPKKDSENLIEDKPSQDQLELDLMWDKIQELKLTDEFAASIMYDKYRRKSGEIPPPVPYSSYIVEDQAVS